MITNCMITNCIITNCINTILEQLWVDILRGYCINVPLHCIIFIIIDLHNYNNQESTGR